MTPEQIRALLAQEIQARDEFIKKAEAELTFRNGRIAMLEQLLNPESPEETEAPA